jgi:hypothetical protein
MCGDLGQNSKQKNTGAQWEEEGESSSGSPDDGIQSDHGNMTSGLGENGKQKNTGGQWETESESSVGAPNDGVTSDMGNMAGDIGQNSKQKNKGGQWETQDGPPYGSMGEGWNPDNIASLMEGDDVNIQLLFNGYARETGAVSREHFESLAACYCEGILVDDALFESLLDNNQEFLFHENADDHGFYYTKEPLRVNFSQPAAGGNLQEGRVLNEVAPLVAAGLSAGAGAVGSAVGNAMTADEGAEEYDEDMFPPDMEQDDQDQYQANMGMGYEQDAMGMQPGYDFPAQNGPMDPGMQQQGPMGPMGPMDAMQQQGPMGAGPTAQTGMPGMAPDQGMMGGPMGGEVTMVSMGMDDPNGLPPEAVGGDYDFSQGEGCGCADCGCDPCECGGGNVNPSSMDQDPMRPGHQGAYESRNAQQSISEQGYGPEDPGFVDDPGYEERYGEHLGQEKMHGPGHYGGHDAPYNMCPGCDYVGPEMDCPGCGTPMGGGGMEQYGAEDPEFAAIDLDDQYEHDFHNQQAGSEQEQMGEMGMPGQQQHQELPGYGDDRGQFGAGAEEEEMAGEGMIGDIAAGAGEMAGDVATAPLKVAGGAAGMEQSDEGMIGDIAAGAGEMASDVVTAPMQAAGGAAGMENEEYTEGYGEMECSESYYPTGGRGGRGGNTPSTMTNNYYGGNMYREECLREEDFGDEGRPRAYRTGHAHERGEATRHGEQENILYRAADTVIKALRKMGLDPGAMTSEEIAEIQDDVWGTPDQRGGAVRTPGHVDARDVAEHIVRRFAIRETHENGMHGSDPKPNKDGIMMGDDTTDSGLRGQGGGEHGRDQSTKPFSNEVHGQATHNSTSAKATDGITDDMGMTDKLNAGQKNVGGSPQAMSGDASKLKENVMRLNRQTKQAISEFASRLPKNGTYAVKFVVFCEGVKARSRNQLAEALTDLEELIQSYGTGATSLQVQYHRPQGGIVKKQRIRFNESNLMARGPVVAEGKVLFRYPEVANDFADQVISEGRKCRVYRHNWGAAVAGRFNYNIAEHAFRNIPAIMDSFDPDQDEEIEEAGRRGEPSVRGTRPGVPRKKKRKKRTPEEQSEVDAGVAADKKKYAAQRRQEGPLGTSRR